MKRINPFRTPGEIPLSFALNGESIRGIPDEFSPVTGEPDFNDGKTMMIIQGQKNGISISVEYIAYSDFPVTEWVATIKNTGGERSGILSDVEIGFAAIPCSAPVLEHNSGDDGTEASFTDFFELVDHPVELSPIGGRSCNGAWPYMRLMTEDGGINIAVGWPGQWRARFEPTPGGVLFTAGLQRMHASLEPGESVRTPRVTLMPFAGNAESGANFWRQWFLRHILIRKNGLPFKPVCAIHDFVDGNFIRISCDQQLAVLDGCIRNGIRPDCWWVDTGWYECKGNWRNSGTWKHDRERFPEGLRPLGERCEKEDIEFLVWFEPERVRIGTELAQEHPEWLLHRDEAILDSDMQSIMHPGMRFLTDSFLLNLADDACCDALIERVNRIIKESKITVYRQDFNFNPLPHWIYNEVPDRIGMLENRHITNYLRFWDTLIKDNPGLWIDSCASGGRRNDLETLRRSIPLHYTDVGEGNHPLKQSHFHTMFRWIPYFKSSPYSADNDLGGYVPANPHPVTDRFAFYACAMTPSVAFNIPPEPAEEFYSLVRGMLPVWRRAADLMLRGSYHPLTECRRRAEDWYAVQFHDEDRQEGLILAVRNAACPEERITLHPHFEEAERFRFESSGTGKTFCLMGEEAASFSVALEKRSGELFFYHRM